MEVPRGGRQRQAQHQPACVCCVWHKIQIRRGSWVNHGTDQSIHRSIDPPIHSARHAPGMYISSRLNLRVLKCRSCVSRPSDESCMLCCWCMGTSIEFDFGVDEPGVLQLAPVGPIHTQRTTTAKSTTPNQTDGPATPRWGARASGAAAGRGAATGGTASRARGGSRRARSSAPPNAGEGPVFGVWGWVLFGGVWLGESGIGRAL